LRIAQKTQLFQVFLVKNEYLVAQGASLYCLLVLDMLLEHWLQQLLLPPLCRRRVFRADTGRVRQYGAKIAQHANFAC
jgi:hypothetical protein